MTDLQTAPARAEARTGGPVKLATVATVFAIIRDGLLIIILAAILIFGGALVKGISDLGDDDPAEPVSVEQPVGGWTKQDCEAAALDGEQTPAECDQYFGEGG